MLIKRHAIWDVDNCLADDKWRAPLIDWHLTGNERYARYNDQMMGDKGHYLEAFRVISKIAVPIFFTGRCEVYERTTIAWLKAGGYLTDLPSWHLYMRGNDDRSSPADLKRAMLEKVLSRGLKVENIIAAFDDIPAIVDMYTSYGIPATILRINDDLSGIYEPRDLAPVSNHA